MAKIFYISPFNSPFRKGDKGWGMQGGQGLGYARGTRVGVCKGDKGWGETLCKGTRVGKTPCIRGTKYGKTPCIRETR